MKTRSNILLIILFAGIIFYTSCREKEKYPPVPHIEYLDFTKISNVQGIDEKGILKFSFTDGDGDIGLTESDTFPPFNPGSIFYYNLFIASYKKKNGVFIQDSSSNGRIPVITPSGQNKSIKGNIEVELFINNPQPPFTNYDTIYFEASIADRLQNISNIIRTPDIIVKKH